MKPHPIFFPLSLLYGVVIWLRNLFFDSGILKQKKISVPVISVGNITSGGTGKTPIVENILEVLMSTGKKTALITRGYGRDSQGYIVVSDGTKICASVHEAGDEPMIIAKKFPQVIVIADEQRVRGANNAVNDFNAEIILLDDGFQHRYLQRDINIVLLNSQYPLEQSLLLPAGYRREFLSALQRATHIVFTKCKKEEQFPEIFFEKETFTSEYVPVGLRNVFTGKELLLNEIAEKNIAAVCGIADPKNFRDTLHNLQCNIIFWNELADHFSFTEQYVKSLLDNIRNTNAEMLIVTEKDAVKLQQFPELFSKFLLYELQMKAIVREDTKWKSLFLELCEK